MKGHFVPIIELRKEYKLKFCEAFPPCAKHREGDRSSINQRLKDSIFRANILSFIVY